MFTKLNALLDQRAVEITKKELEEILTQLVSALKNISLEEAAQIAKEITVDSVQYIHGEYEVHHLHMWQHPEIGDVLINITITTEEDKGMAYDLASKDGVFGYVYNLDAPICSELGYSFYKKDHEDLTYRRIG